MNNIKIFAGSSSIQLGTDICSELSKIYDAKFSPFQLGKSKTVRFADGELAIEIQESARGCEVVIIMSTCCPVAENYVELLIMLDAFKRAAVKRISVVMPYMGFSRQDKKVHPREPITSALFLKLLKKSGADHIMTMDVHAEQVQGMFDGPFDNLYGGPILADWLKDNVDLKNTVMVSPDINGAKRAHLMSKFLNLDGIAVVNKERPKANESVVLEIVGDVKGKNCILIDDMIDTGGSLINAANAILDKGARDVIAMATHGVFSGEAIARLAQSKIGKVVVLDTIPQHWLLVKGIYEKFVVLPTAPMIAKAINNHFNHESVSSLFSGYRS